mgnify:CR=1 FL=1
MNFNELGLHGDLLKAINELGFETPTPIQQQTIPMLNAEPTDLVALAQTGTGKTAAFGLPILNHINCENKNVQALVLAPTRELCVQINNDIRNFGKYLHGFSSVAIYGGAKIDGQIKDIRRGVQVVVATPGRLIDVIERKVINLKTVNIVVLDDKINNKFPDSVVSNNSSKIYVGHIRPVSNSTFRRWNFFISGDQLKRGAAYNVYLILLKLLDK